jgi:glycosyltransferase involved in cell wall biosynthesis
MKPEKAVVTVVVPFLNSLQYLERTAPTLVHAARARGSVELIYVDNGSTDRSLEYLQSLMSHTPNLIRVLSRPGITIAAMRNEGVRAGTGAYFAFLDADCSIQPNYFDAAIDVLNASGASATGCEVDLPSDPHWVERTLHDLHYMGRDREVVYINSANFFVEKHAFESIGGFREDLRTGEDADIGQRMIVANFRIRENPIVQAIHYGNPKSVGEYYRRVVWHGLGMFATVTRHRLDRPTVMLLVHFALTIAGVAWLVVGRGPWLTRTALLAALQLLVPAITVAFRVKQTRRLVNLPRALYLYWLYYWARLQAVALILSGRSRRFSK